MNKTMTKPKTEAEVKEIILKGSTIHKSYRQGLRSLEILKGIDVEIAKGEFVCMVGPSGAGKSTLLHILGGLDVPSIGKVFLDDDNIYKLKDRARAKVRNDKIGFVFQFYHLLPEFNALENVVLPMLIQEDRSNINKAIRQRGEEMLEKVGLKERMKHTPNQLSGGEQQRVAIARALINKPKIVLCDEPTGNLDSKSGQEIIHLLTGLQKENEQTLLIVTHDERIAKQADRTMHMKDGQITFSVQKERTYEGLS